MNSHCPARRRLLAAAAALSLTGCGFRLRGPRPLPFDSAHIASAVGGELTRRIRKRIEAGGSTRIVATRDGAAVVLDLLSADREKNIIGLSGAGKVREYEFVQNLRFRLTAADGRELIPQTRLTATREATWDDSAILAKDQEEALLFSDMEEELVGQLMRRLEAARPDA